MWLFDDLLKKPTTDTTAQAGGSTGSSAGATGGGNPPIDPLATTTETASIKIEKMTESSIVTDAHADIEMPSSPPPVTVSAVDDSSSILVATPNMSEAITPETNLVVEVAPSITVEAPTAPINTNIVSETPVVDLSNLFGESTPVAIEESTVSEEQKIPETAETIETPLMMTTPVETETSSLLDLDESSHAEETGYEHPSDFIAASIEKIDTMVEKIDTAHSAKLEEALGYKAEKEKYTELEEQAYADAEKLVEEKEHALSMRTYFVGQGSTTEIAPSEENPTSATLEVATPESPLFTMTEESTPTIAEEKKSPVASVETTLTGLAVASAVTETVAPTAATTPASVNEEPLVLAS